MATVNGHVFVQVTDVNGDVAEVRMPFNTTDAATAAELNGIAAAFGVAVRNASNGMITRTGFSILGSEAAFVIGTTPPFDAEYSSVTDGARFQFATVNGERSSATVPAPKELVFGSDSNVVDPGEAVSAAFITFWQGNANAPSGTAYTLYKGGIKVGRRARRRRTALRP